MILLKMTRRAFYSQELYEAVGSKTLLPRGSKCTSRTSPKRSWEIGTLGNLMLVLPGSLCSVTNLRRGLEYPLSSPPSVPARPRSPAHPHTPAVLIQWAQLVFAGGGLNLPKPRERHPHQARSPAGQRCWDLGPGSPGRAVATVRLCQAWASLG